jgi:hypothetical protein
VCKLPVAVQPCERNAVCVLVPCDFVRQGCQSLAGVLLRPGDAPGSIAAAAAAYPGTASANMSTSAAACVA